MTASKTILHLDKTQPIFMGMDVHKNTWSISLFHCDQVIDRATMRSDFKQLKKFLSRYDDFKIYSVYEAGFSGFHLHHQLASIGVSNIVTPPNKIPVLQGDLVKTDRRDSLKLATFLAKGLLRSIHIPSHTEVDHRQILRTREQLKRKKARAINQIKSLIIQHGIALNSVGISQETAQLLLETDDLPPMVKMTVKLHWEQICFIKTQMKALEQECKKMVKGDDMYSQNYELLYSIPGVGPLVASALVYEIGDWSRFKNEKQISAFFGLTPSEFSSGDNTYRGRITGQGNKMLRGLLVQSSWKLIEKDDEMRQFYLKISTQTGSKKKAIIAVARKLVCRMFSMIKNGKRYEIQKRYIAAIA